MLIDGSTNDPIDLEWTSLEYGSDTVHCADMYLTAGTYYVRVNGYYSDLTTEYVLYTYWRPWADFLEFAYDIFYRDMLE
jgi:hypothetical protein